jgi:hypothetical protein
MHFAKRLSKLAFPFLHANGYRRYTALGSVAHILHNPGLCIMCVSEYVENGLCIMCA